MIFRYYLLTALAALIFVWPIKYFLSYYHRKKRLSKYVEHLPMLNEYPLIGSGHLFMGKTNEELMQTARSIIDGQEKPFSLWLGPKLLIIIDKPDDIQTVCNAKGCIEKGDIYKFFNRGVGLFTAKAHIWKPQRKQLAASFSFNIVQSFVPIFNAKSAQLVRNVGTMLDKGYFDLSHFTSACTLDIVCETILGTEVEIQNGKNLDYMEAITKLMSIVARRMVNVFLHPEVIYKQTKMYESEMEYIRKTELLPHKIIKEKMLEFAQRNKVNADDSISDEDCEQSYSTPQIFIDRLLRLHHKGIITESEIQDHVNLIIFGGNDTSSLATSHTILMLAMHPKIQERVIDEINEVFVDLPLDCPISNDHVVQLSYLEQVLKETLRLLPVAPYIVRECTEDTKISDCIIPTSAEVVVSVYSAHRRADVWGPNADKFDPDNFHPNVAMKRSPYAFMAFSRGVRDCLGMRFAYVSIKIMIVKLLRKYKFSTYLKLEDLNTRLDVTMKLITGPMVEIEERRI